MNERLCLALFVGADQWFCGQMSVDIDVISVLRLTDVGSQLFLCGAYLFTTTHVNVHRWTEDGAQTRLPVYNSSHMNHCQATGERQSLHWATDVLAQQQLSCSSLFACERADVNL